MKPIGTVNHWKGEAAKLPRPTCNGERCISPGGVPFQARVEDDTDGRTVLGWAPTAPDWTPLPFLFCIRPL